MSARIHGGRRVFRIESLEIRNAPSHIGGLGHVAAALHRVDGLAHVRTFRDTSVDRKNPLDRNTGVDHSTDGMGVGRDGNEGVHDRNTGVDRSTDTVAENNSTDPNAGDTTSNDVSSIDRSGQS